MGKYGEYILTRNKNKKWVVRNSKGQYVTKDVKKSVLKQVFGKRKPKTRPVEYVRQFIYRKDEPGYYTEDVIEVVDEPIDITDQEIEANLTDPYRLTMMKGKLLEKYEDVRYAVPRDLVSGKGGARRLTALQAKGLERGFRLEDMRYIGSRGG